MKKSLIILLLIIVGNSLYGQNHLVLHPDLVQSNRTTKPNSLEGALHVKKDSNWLNFEFQNTQCISDEHRQEIFARAKQNIQILRSEGKIPKRGSLRSMMAPILFDWPLRLAAGFQCNSYFGISNYVDHDVSFQGNLRDYNCGTRTYDLISGYNHQGLDVFLYPFNWNMVAKDQVQVIAAAEGIIYDKLDGNNHFSCAFGGNWNAVYILHSDGSAAWYGHLKEGSLTSKTIGESVVRGEYLGIVASSGSSTGPHLHFEVYDDYESTPVLVDPFEGPCDSLNMTAGTRWVSQRPYRVPTVNKVTTHTIDPGFAPCPMQDTINADDDFNFGDPIRIWGWLTDVIQDDSVLFQIFDAANMERNNFITPVNNTSNASSYFNTPNLPFIATNPGTWTVQVSIIQQNTNNVLSMYHHHFRVGLAPCEISLNNIDTNHVTCPGAADGKIILHAASPNTIEYILYPNIPPGPRIVQTDSVFNNLTPGAYNVIVRTQGDTVCASALIPIEIEAAQTNCLALAKFVDTVIQIVHNPGNVMVRIGFRFANNGPVAQDSIYLKDDLDGQFGTALVNRGSLSITGTDGLGGTFTILDSFTNSLDTIALVSSANKMLPGDQFTIYLELETDPNALGAPCPIKNSAIACSKDTLSGFIIVDISDAGPNPLTINDQYAGDRNTESDSTIIGIPALGVAKWVGNVQLLEPPDSVGNFAVTYMIKIVNLGNTIIGDVVVEDDLDALNMLGTALMVPPNPELSILYPNSPSYSINPIYNGKDNISIFKPSDLVTIPKGDSILVSLKIEVNPNATGAPNNLMNQVYAYGMDGLNGLMNVVVDSSDNGISAESLNGNMRANDPTPLNLMDINISKQILSVRPFNQASNPGEALAEFQLLVKNDGNTPLFDVMVIDNVQTQLSTIFLSEEVAPYLTILPEKIDGGIMQVDSATTSHTAMGFTKIIDGGDNDTLNRDEYIDIRYTLRFNPNAVASPSYESVMNQAAASGMHPDIGMTSDTSDTGSYPEHSNPGELGDTGEEDDPTLLTLPMINLAKELIKVRKPLSGTFGNFEAIITINVENTGNTPLDSIFLYEDLATQYGLYFVKMVDLSYSESSAAFPPALNAGYTGMVPNHSLTLAENSTSLLPGDTLSLQLIVEIDPDADGLLCDSLFNQIVAFARANDVMGNIIFDAVDVPMITYDSSDVGLDPEGFNMDHWADRGTANDSTIIPDCWKNCDPACADLVNVSLGSNCELLLEPGMFISNVSQECLDLCFWEIVKIVDEYGKEVSNPIGYEQLGQMLTVTVQNIVCQNPCWSKAKIEEKQPPTIVCRNDTISCLHMGDRADLIVLADNCMYAEPQTDILEQRWTDLGCEDREFIGYLSRKVGAIDLWGNYNECRDTLWVWKETLDSLVCPEDTALACNLQHRVGGNYVDVLWRTGAKGYTYLDDQGYAHPWPTDAGGIAPAPYLKSTDPDQADGYMIPMKTDAGPVFDNGGKCHIVYKYKDHVIPTCGKAYKIRREWIISDWCAKRDTTCIQWIKITDELPPVIDNRYFLPDNDPDLGPWLIPPHDLKASVDAHDCKAHVALEDIRNLVERRTGISHYLGGWAKECDDDINLYYELEYADPTHPGKKIVIQENYNEKDYIYLPAGYYEITWRLQDQCWNESRARQKVWVLDEIPPVPVCDEITQVTLDPEACWARIFAKDLDDGSHDNCCEQLHFAVAHMDSIDYWRNYWNNYFVDCLDSYDYQHYHKYIEEAIEEWINIFVFDDYVDVTECGTENLVLRVYEACNLPKYDPHVFYGGEHEWYWWNLSAKFAGWYYWRLNDYLHYSDPRATFSCFVAITTLPVNENDFGFNPVQWDYPVLAGECAIVGFTDKHVGMKAPICDYYWPNSGALAEWVNRVKSVYPSEVSITEGISEKKRYNFAHLYNDCMIEVIKDDKTPPVCKAPADVTYYCDGVPYHWQMPVGVDIVKGWGAGYAHDVCYVGDVFDPNCDLDKTSGTIWDVSNGGTNAIPGGSGWCVATPWNGGAHGYYGGPLDDYYAEDCDTKHWGVDGLVYDHDWKPIYCRVWLLLDQYDNTDASGKPDPKSYFGEVTYSDNCWVDPPTYEDSGSLNECGVGVLTRTWTVADKCENQSVCYQRVIIKPRSDFEVIFPADVEVNCDDLQRLDPETTGRPEVSDDDCELIGINYVDERFTITQDGCYKILRTWTLIDWCVYDPDQHSRHPDVIVDDRIIAGENRGCVYRNLKDDGDGYMIYLQVIKVVDREAPEVTCIAPQVICNYDENCELDVLVLDFGSATDNCALAEEIAYRYIIKPEQSEELSTWIYGHGHTFTSELPFGIHDVYLIATDRCGNEDTCTTQVAINDCKPPTPYCYDGFATVVMPSSMSIEVWAKDLDAGSFDNCTEKEDLNFTFDAAGLESNRIFTCADIPDGKMEQIVVEIYVWDEAGNVDKCVTYILLQDGSGNVCTDQIIAAQPGSKDMDIIMSGQGKVEKSGVENGGLGLREVGGIVELFQNRPNPFRNETEIGFYLPKAQKIVLRIYNVNGQTLAVHEGNYVSGYYVWRYNNTSGKAGTGLLYYQLQTESLTITKKMVRVE